MNSLGFRRSPRPSAPIGSSTGRRRNGATCSFWQSMPFGSVARCPSSPRPQCATPSTGSVQSTMPAGGWTTATSPASTSPLSRSVAWHPIGIPPATSARGPTQRGLAEAHPGDLPFPWASVAIAPICAGRGRVLPPRKPQPQLAKSWAAQRLLLGDHRELVEVGELAVAFHQRALLRSSQGIL